MKLSVLVSETEKKQQSYIQISQQYKSVCFQLSIYTENTKHIIIQSWSST